MLSEPVTGFTPLTETSILPGLGLEDLRPDLIARARAHEASGADLDLSDEEFLLRAGLARRDDTGATGILLPALLLFGRDDALRGALPDHGTRAWVRDAKRRLTREDIRTNLLETFDRLMAFAARHLPAGAPGDEAPENLRDLVFAEIFINSLLHRDYTKPFPAVFGIEPGRIYLENGSTGAGAGPKNPALARVFTRLGWKRDPGIPSPLTRWGRVYFGSQPLTFEGSTYRLLASYPPQGDKTMQVEPRKPPERPSFKLHAPASTMQATSAPRSRPSIQELEALLSEELPAFPQNLEESQDFKVAWEEPAPSVRPAFEVRWQTEGAEAPQKSNMQAMQARVPAAETLKPAVQASIPDMQGGAPPMQATPARQTPLAASEKPPLASSFPRSPFPSGPGPTAPAPPNTTERTARILQFCETPRHRAEIQEFAGFQNRDYFRKEILNPLIEQGLLAPTLPDKPNSPNQQYRTIRPL